MLCIGEVATKEDIWPDDDDDDEGPLDRLSVEDDPPSP